jgi:four helix bundle protein
MAMSMTKAMPGLINRWPRGYYYLSDQLRRAMASISLNLAEGNAKRTYPERKRFFSIAMGSACECSAIFEIALNYELIDQSQSDYFQDNLLQIYKMLYKLK